MRKHFRQVADFNQRHSAMLAAPVAGPRVPSPVSHYQQLHSVEDRTVHSIFQNME
jgi:hypothetical protein